MASNQDNGRRADALILYVRHYASTHNAIVLKPVGELTDRAVTRNWFWTREE